VQSPINILSYNSYKVSLPNLLYFGYWCNNSVEISMRNNGHARKSVSFIFTIIMSKNKRKTNEMISYFFQYIFIVQRVMMKIKLLHTLPVDHYSIKNIFFLTFIYIGVLKDKKEVNTK